MINNEDAKVWLEEVNKEIKWIVIDIKNKDYEEAKRRLEEYIPQTEGWYEDDGLEKGQIPEIDEVMDKLYNLYNVVEEENEKGMTYYEYQEAMTDRLMHELQERMVEDEM